MIALHALVLGHLGDCGEQVQKAFKLFCISGTYTGEGHLKQFLGQRFLIYKQQS